jgi:hypothetical protein
MSTDADAESPEGRPRALLRERQKGDPFILNGERAMTSATVRKVLMVPAILVTLLTVVSAAPVTQQQQKTFFCHGTNWPSCLGVFNVLGSDLSYQMNGSPSLAVVDVFTDPAKARTVTWTNINMKGTTEKGDAISATLDASRQSSGTVLSVGNSEFPANATMRFFFQIQTGGLTLVSERPAVFQGIIHSIPPAAGDVLTLSGPVDFHPQGESQNVGALKKAAVSFNDPTQSH